MMRIQASGGMWFVVGGGVAVLEETCAVSIQWGSDMGLNYRV